MAKVYFRSTESKQREAEAHRLAEAKSPEQLEAEAAAITRDSQELEAAKGPHPMDKIIREQYERQLARIIDGPAQAAREKLQAQVARLTDLAWRQYPAQMRDEAKRTLSKRDAEEEYHRLVDIHTEAARLVGETPDIITIAAEVGRQHPELIRAFVDDPARLAFYGLSASE
jgi:hypothetical protein